MPNPSTLEMSRLHDTPEERLAALEVSSQILNRSIGTIEKKLDHHVERLHVKIDNLPERLHKKFTHKSEFNGLRWLVRGVIAGLLAIAFSVIQLKLG